MIEGVVAYLENVLLPLGAWGVFSATIIEQVIAPIPSAWVQLGGGFFLINTENFWLALWKIILVVSIPSAIAVTTASFFIYYLSYFVGKPLVDRFGKFLGIKWHDIELLQQKFSGSRKDDLLLFFLRTLPAVPTVAVDIFCGVVRYPIKTYLLITLFGTLIRATIFGLIGWRVGSLYFAYAEYISRVEKYLLLGVVIAAIVFVVVRTKKIKTL